MLRLGAGILKREPLLAWLPGCARLAPGNRHFRGNPAGVGRV